MKKSTALSQFPWASYLTPLVLFLWAYAFLWLLHDANYARFLQPRFWFLPAAGLAIAALCLAATAGERAPHTPPKQGLRALFLLLPLLYLFQARDHTLDSYAYTQRNVPRTTAQFDRPVPTPNADGLYDVTLLDCTAHSPLPKGARIHTLGQVYRGPEAPQGCINLFQFTIVCCLADAVPVSIAARGPATQSLEADTWVEVEATLSEVATSAGNIPCLDVETATPIPTPPPHRRYIY